MGSMSKTQTAVTGGRVRVDQQAYRHAMRDQGKVKPKDFPINNRAARRRAKKAKDGPI